MPVSVISSSVVPNTTFSRDSYTLLEFNPDILSLINTYMSINNFNFFLKSASSYRDSTPEHTKILLGKIFRACAKIFSGIKLEGQFIATVHTDIYLSQLCMICYTMESWMIDNRFKSSIKLPSGGDVVLDMSAEASLALDDINNWNLFSSLFSESSTSAPFDLNEKLFILLSGCSFNLSTR